MKHSELVWKARKLSRPFRITDGDKFRLADADPRDTGAFEAGDESRAKEMLKLGIEALAAMQDRLYAGNSRSLLVIFQAMDAAGKDSAIKHVMSGLNPQGCQVASFKQPSAEELDHDYLWRCQRHLPERGRIGIFNRSYYEEVLVVRVHPGLLEAQKLPDTRPGRKLWEQRYGHMRRFERYLADNGTTVLKFFLHVSREEQKKRFLARLDDPERNWKFSQDDVKERRYWKEYMKAYEDAIRATATPEGPWYVVPADHKWFTRIVVASAIVDTMASMDLAYPRVPAATRAQFAAARRALRSE